MKFETLTPFFNIILPTSSFLLQMMSYQRIQTIDSIAKYLFLYGKKLEKIGFIFIFTINLAERSFNLCS
jgi:hypothetical protein